MIGLVGSGAPSQIPVSEERTLTTHWLSVPSLWRLRLTGTGACEIDARDSLGNITLAADSFTVSEATDAIRFPGVPDNTIDVRFNLTGTCAAGII